MNIEEVKSPDTNVRYGFNGSSMLIFGSHPWAIQLLYFARKYIKIRSGKITSSQYAYRRFAATRLMATSDLPFVSILLYVVCAYSE